MLFEEREEITMAAQKEKQFTVRMDEATYDYLVKKSGALDVTRSEIMRTSFLVAIHQIERLPGLLKIQLQDIQEGEK